MATMPVSLFTFVLVGAGRVGTAVAELLRRAGHEPVGVASRSRDSGARAAELLATEVVEPERIPACDVVLLGVPDDALEAVASAIAPSLEESTVVIHFSGASGVRQVSDKLLASTPVCALHPVQACPDFETAIARLPGSYWGVTTTQGAGEWSSELVRNDLEGFPIDVQESDRPVWHAAAVTTSNGIAALLALGENLLRATGVETPTDILGPLARGTIENAISGGGGGKTLTGPAVRGEVEIIERHARAIARDAPDLLPGYRRAAQLVIEAGSIEGRVQPDTAAAIEQILERP